MSPCLLLQPTKLETLAIKKLGDYIALQAERLVTPITELLEHDATKAEALLSRQIEIIRNRLNCNVPRSLYDKLLRETVRALLQTVTSLGYILYREWDDDLHDNLLNNKSQRHVIGRMVETLFTKNLTRVVINGTTEKSLCLASLCSKSYMLTGLSHLRIVLWSFTKNAEIIRLLKGLHSLQNVSLNFCTDDILKCLTENCKLIEKLNFSNTRDVHINDNSIDILVQLSHLRSIKLRGTAVTQKGIETLLLSCENIEYIIGTPFIAPALEHIASLKEYAGKRFKLKSFENEVETTLKQLRLLVQMCPLLQHIIFDNAPLVPNSCFRARNPTLYRYDLTVLNDLQDLRQLTLRQYDFYRDKIQKVLKIKGQHLVELVLEVDEIDLSALKCIIQMCPNLESLTIIISFNYEEKNMATNLRSLNKRTRTFVTDLYIKNKDTPPLKKLKYLHLDIYDYEPPMRDEARQLVIFMLLNCPNVSYIDTGDGVLLTDDIMFTVLDKNPLIRLKQMEMWQSQLSMSFIDRIVQNCISPVIVCDDPLLLAKLDLSVTNL